MSLESSKPNVIEPDAVMIELSDSDDDDMFAFLTQNNNNEHIINVITTPVSNTTEKNIPNAPNKNKRSISDVNNHDLEPVKKKLVFKLSNISNKKLDKKKSSKRILFENM